MGTDTASTNPQQLVVSGWNEPMHRSQIVKQIAEVLIANSPSRTSNHGTQGHGQAPARWA
eukprot:2888258-Amphidinium_carterae.2